MKGFMSMEESYPIPRGRLLENCDFEKGDNSDLIIPIKKSKVRIG